jgi:hypothetical protein
MLSAHNLPLPSGGANRIRLAAWGAVELDRVCGERYHSTSQHQYQPAVEYALLTQHFEELETW